MPNFERLSKYWHLYTHPWRPGNNTLELVSSYMSDAKRVCILGSTIEFRELCAQKGCQTDCYDISREMLQMHPPLHAHEKLYNQNWFEIDKKYDLILGDLVLFMFPHDMQASLLKSLENNLLPGGSILLRSGEAQHSGSVERKKFLAMIQDSKDTKSFLETLNMASFEERLGSNSSIELILKEHNKLLHNFFTSSFQSIEPYAGGGFYKDEVHMLGDRVMTNDFILSKEFVTCYTLDKL